MVRNMKHIRGYKIFEKLGLPVEIINTLKDILCELVDDGRFDYNFLESQSPGGTCIRIGRWYYLNNKYDGDMAKLYDNSIFSLFEIKDIVLRIKKYLQSEGYSVVFKNNIGGIVNFTIDENCFLVWLIITKDKSPVINESLEEREEIIGDICLDLKDEGYSIDPIEKYTESRKPKWGIFEFNPPNLYFFSIKANRNASKRIEIDEVKDTLIRIKNYLGENFHHFTLIPNYQSAGDIKYNIKDIEEIDSLKYINEIYIIYIWYTN